MGGTYSRTYTAIALSGLLLGTFVAFAQRPAEPYHYDKLMPVELPEKSRVRMDMNEPAVIDDVTDKEANALNLRVRDRFVGSWELVTFEVANAKGEFVERPMTGRIMYDSNGNMAAQLMPPAEEENERVDGYYAYFGTFEIDFKEHSVTHHVEASLLTRWIGTDLVRYYEFNGDDTLILTLKRDDLVVSRLVWKRLGLAESEKG